jgi:uncharacterized BrkB/YihY/UPF0761 family membrane protein
MGYTEYFLTSTYRDWGNFSVEHLVVLVGLLCFILVLYSIIRTKRTSAFKKARYAIFESKPILNKQDLPRVNRFFFFIIIIIEFTYFFYFLKKKKESVFDNCESNSKGN